MYRIYKYTNKINKKIYIGLTSRSIKDRAGSNGIGYKLCPNFYADILKYGFINFDIEILEDNISDLIDAGKREEYFISKYNSRNPAIGYNIQPGGSNFIMTDEIKKIIGERVKASKKFIKNNYNTHHKEVVGINIKTKEVLEFDSLSKASRSLNLSRGSLGHCCHNYKNRKYLGGYLWFFKSDYDPENHDYINEYILHRKNVTYGAERNRNISTTKKNKFKDANVKNNTFQNICKPVVRIDPLTGKELEYVSAVSAARENNIKAPSNITLVCSGKRKSAGGYLWKWKNQQL